MDLALRDVLLSVPHVTRVPTDSIVDDRLDRDPIPPLLPFLYPPIERVPVDRVADSTSIGDSPRVGLRRRSHRPACLISDRFAQRHYRNVGTSDRHHGRMLDQREAPAKINSVFRSRAAQRDQANVVAFAFRTQRFQRVMLVLP